NTGREANSDGPDFTGIDEYEERPGCGGSQNASDEGDTARTESFCHATEDHDNDHLDDGCDQGRVNHRVTFHVQHGGGVGNDVGVQQVEPAHTQQSSGDSHGQATEGLREDIQSRDLGTVVQLGELFIDRGFFDLQPD